MSMTDMPPKWIEDLLVNGEDAWSIYGDGDPAVYVEWYEGRVFVGSNLTIECDMCHQLWGISSTMHPDAIWQHGCGNVESMPDQWVSHLLDDIKAAQARLDAIDDDDEDAIAEAQASVDDAIEEARGRVGAAIDKVTEEARAQADHYTQKMSDDLVEGCREYLDEALAARKTLAESLTGVGLDVLGPDARDYVAARDALQERVRTDRCGMTCIDDDDTKELLERYEIAREGLGTDLGPDASDIAEALDGIESFDYSLRSAASYFEGRGYDPLDLATDQELVARLVDYGACTE